MAVSRLQAANQAAHDKLTDTRTTAMRAWNGEKFAIDDHAISN